MNPDDQARAVSAADKVALLRRHILFHDLDLTVCEGLAANAKMKCVARGATIFYKGDPGTCLFAVYHGVVQLAAALAEGKSTVFNQIGRGDIFGEIALLDGQPRTADALALTDCKLLIIERRDFLPLLRSVPELTIKLLELLCARLRCTSEQVEDLTFLDLKGRLAKTLLRFAKYSPHGREIAASQADLSQSVGMTREMINKQLRAWVKDGWIEVERRRIVLLRPDALAGAIPDEC